MHTSSIKPYIIMFVLGFLGIVSTLSLIPNLFALQSTPPSLSMEVIQIISVVQSSIYLLLMLWLGAVFSKKVGLTSPVIFALSDSKNVYNALKPQIIPAIAGGIVGGVIIIAISGFFSSYLPPEFLSAGEKLDPPWYTKILYGGITEELLIRWGLMSFLVWGGYRITQKKGTEIRPHNYFLAIVISALIFAIGHLPVAFALSLELTRRVLSWK